MNNSYDAVVVGAGIVGQAMALGLAQLNLKVAIVDKASAPDMLATKDVKTNSGAAQAKDFSSRVSAISLASQQLLESIGAWQYISRKQAYTNMEVWDQDGFGHIAFDASQASSSLAEQDTCLGHIIENEQLNMALYKALKSYPNADCLFATSILNMQTSETSAQVVLENGKVLQTKLLLGADGANSQVRESFGFKQTFWDYDHTAIVANVETQHKHENTAKQAFTPYGPLAFLPLANANTLSIVFSQQSEQAQKLMLLSNKAFEQALQVAIDNHYGSVSLVSERVAIPLRMRYARQWTCQHVALLGDAAHTIHPLAGQGANLGLADVQAMLKLISDNAHNMGEVPQLRRYERWRKAEALKVIATMEGFKRLFDGNDPVKKLARNTGLAVANKLPLIKQFFIQQASS